MAPAKKEGGRIRRRPGGDQGDGGRTVESKTAEQGRGMTMVDIDPWGSFFEKFWEQAEGESTNRPDGRRESARGTRPAGTKSGRRGRSTQEP
jgi:hypothetical protein